jgi:hypothetical protein
MLIRKLNIQSKIILISSEEIKNPKDHTQTLINKIHRNFI